MSAPFMPKVANQTLDWENAHSDSWKSAATSRQPWPPSGELNSCRRPPSMQHLHQEKAQDSHPEKRPNNNKCPKRYAGVQGLSTKCPLFDCWGTWSQTKRIWQHNGCHRRPHCLYQILDSTVVLSNLLPQHLKPLMNGLIAGFNKRIKLQAGPHVCIVLRENLQGAVHSHNGICLKYKTISLLVKNLKVLMNPLFGVYLYQRPCQMTQ